MRKDMLPILQGFLFRPFVMFRKNPGDFHSDPFLALMNNRRLEIFQLLLITFITVILLYQRCHHKKRINNCERRDAGSND